jgi:hypothetical protein
MDNNRREHPRFSVNLYVERRDCRNEPPCVLDLSASGYLVRGEILAGQGGIFHASFRVHPSSGEMRVTTSGRVMHSRQRGGEYEYGIKIESFGSPDEETAYMSYVNELASRPQA